jgi:hypothetical protein
VSVDSVHSPINHASQINVSSAQISRFCRPSQALTHAAATSGRSVGSDSSFASSSSAAALNSQSRSSRLCDPDDESALDVD